MDNFWDQVYFNNSLREWGIALSIIIVSFLCLKILQSILLSRLRSWAKKSKTTVDDLVLTIINSLAMPFLYILSVYYGLQYLNLGTRVPKVLHIGMLVVSTYFVIRIISTFISYFFSLAIARQEGDDRRKKQAVGIQLIIKLVLWVVGIIFLIDNLGYDITTIIAGLGIGGIAIALAAQTILGDLFSYIVIFFDKPFEIGDFVIVDDKLGTIEYIGIKTTRIRTLSGEQLICSNTDLTNSRLHNFKRMQERRIQFDFRIVYETSASQLQQVPAMVKEIINSMDGVRFDRAHFKKFGVYSLEFEVIYYVLTPEYNTYMDKQQEINFQLFKRFEKEKLVFAYPTQTLIMNPSQEIKE